MKLSKLKYKVQARLSLSALSKYCWCTSREAPRAYTGLIKLSSFFLSSTMMESVCQKNPKFKSFISVLEIRYWWLIITSQQFNVPHSPPPPSPSQCQIMELCFFEEYIREADKKLLARHSVTPLSASEEMKDDSLNVSSLHCGTLGVKSRDVSNLL